MDTPAPTTPAKGNRKPRQKRIDAGRDRYEYHVTCHGVPCRLDESRVLHRKPILVPCRAGQALHIIGRGSRARGHAKILIERSLKALKQAGGPTVFEKTSSVKSALARYSNGFSDWNIVRQKIAYESIGTTG